MRGDVKQQTFPPGAAVVSPANAFGWMDGGIDADYRDMFGAQIERRVQEEIARRYGKAGMPIGEAFVLRTYPEGAAIPPGRPEWLIVAPTMTRPGRHLAQGAGRPRATRDLAGKAVEAALKAAINAGIQPAAFPGMGIGTAAAVDANAFAKAFADAHEAADETLAAVPAPARTPAAWRPLSLKEEQFVKVWEATRELGLHDLSQRVHDAAMEGAADLNVRLPESTLGHWSAALREINGVGSQCGTRNLRRRSTARSRKRGLPEDELAARPVRRLGLGPARSRIGDQRPQACGACRLPAPCRILAAGPLARAIRRRDALGAPS